MSSCHIKDLSWSKSEGSLVDLDDGKSARNDWTGNKENKTDERSSWSGECKQVVPGMFKTNPFWNELSASNPFLADVAQSSNKEKSTKCVSILKEDPYLFLRESNDRDSAASSGDELNIDYLFLRKASRKSSKCRSTSDLLDIVCTTPFAPVEDPSNGEQVNHRPPPDGESMQNDRDAYKTAWLNQRQLARSLLELNMINQSPGWAQTQSIETHVVCKVNHEGGSVQLPDSDIAVHFPEGHVASGEFQEVGLQAILDSPSSLNHDFSTTVSPLIELTLSNLNTTEAILLEMKIAAEVKKDPFSQVMTEIACLCGSGKEGPFQKVHSCYIYKDTIQVKLTDLSHLMYLVIVAQTNTVNSPAGAWEYIHRKLSVGIYGPKHIHPSFTVVFALFGHTYVPEKLTVCDIKKGGKSMPPVVFQLWGKHTFVLEKPQDLSVFVASCDPDFEVKDGDQGKEIKEKTLKGGGPVIHQHFPFSVTSTRKMHLFVFRVQVKVPNNNLVCQFYVTTPHPAPRPLTGIPTQPNRTEKGKEMKLAPLLSVPTIKYPAFRDRHLHVTSYGVALKTVLRQTKIDYLLEYFKGDTIALLGEDKIKAIGQAKVKEWYVGVLRRKVGLVHCKNVKVITKDQVMDTEDSTISTNSLVEQIALPFKKLTYIYSAILSTVSERICDWKALAHALRLSNVSLDDLSGIQAEEESEKVAYIVKKLKEVCHANKNARRFLYELSVALLKLDCQGLLARITHDAVIFTSAVKLGKGWRELAEKLARLTKQQIEAYESPHRGRNGDVPPERQKAWYRYKVKHQAGLERVAIFAWTNTEALGEQKLIRTCGSLTLSFNSERFLTQETKSIKGKESLQPASALMMWKPAYDFLYTWGAHYGDSYRDMLQDLQSALDKMKNPVTKQWRELTGALILVNCMEVLQANAFSKVDKQ